MCTIAGFIILFLIGWFVYELYKAPPEEEELNKQQDEDALKNIRHKFTDDPKL